MRLGSPQSLSQWAVSPVIAAFIALRLITFLALYALCKDIVRVRMSYPKYNRTPKAKKVRDIYKDRILQFTDEGTYRDLNLPAVYDDARVFNEKYVKLEVCSIPDLARPKFEEAVKGDFRPTRKGEAFGPSWSTHWFKITLRVPQEEVWTANKQLIWNWECHNEGLVYSEDGMPLQGLSGDGERPEWPVPEAWKDGEWHVFYIEASCNGMFGNGNNDQIQPPDPNKWFTLDTADLVAPNHEAIALFVDFWVISDAARELDQDSWESHVALKTANDIMNAFDPEDRSTVATCRQIAKAYLGADVDSASVYASGQRDQVYAIGHCHIDTAWLWPYAETRRKTARSWASQLALLRQYPEHRFACSQAQQYKWLKAEYPRLFEEIKTEVKNGKWNYIGGSWVESDTNMPVGEALVRQFLLGQRFFESNFGKRSVTYWLPDTFGYSPQVPQLARGAGMSRFLTQKLSWNNINDFPNSTFNWVALDGSQVLAHMPPANTYTSRVEFHEVNQSLKGHKNLEQNQTGLLVFGIGDGGGGPTGEMLEKLRRMRGLSDNVGLFPRVKMGHTADEYFDTLEKQTDYGKDLVTWMGELYFEFHRGTYTTQSDVKKYNRKNEILLHDVEFLATLASLANKDYKYPKQAIDDCWEVVCLNQFHDVLPGSAIEMVYDDAKELHREVEAKATALAEDALAALGLEAEASAATEPVAVSTLPWARQELVTVETAAPKALAQQTLGGKHYALMESTPGGLMRPVAAAAAAQSTVSVAQLAENHFVLQNQKLVVTIEDGVISSIYDVDNDREVLADGGKANQFVIFDDKPLYFQAWDTEVYSLDTRKVLSGAKTYIHEAGPLKCSVVVEQKISAVSWLKSTIALTSAPLATSAAAPPAYSYVDITTEVEWRENSKFLKVEFPVDVHSDTAAYETQFGYAKRPTHFNTSWDVAKFEVCCHKWADLSEATYGVTILNDCKYGFATHGNLQRLSLLRAPKAPDGNADMGHHVMRYAILPHAGGLNSEIVRTAYNFNYPVRLLHAPKKTAGKVEDVLSAIRVANSNIVLSNVKRGEDDEDTSLGDFPAKPGQSVILRVYDALGGKVKTTITTTLPVKKAFYTNLLEDELSEIELRTVKTKKGTVTEVPVALRPFEVSTVKLQL
ncbi:glycosyl hydrolases family 38 N-terminal domain-containing protein [Dipodascopsis tothii]|uniref:glycosyl hydrolases family 38 N-terminal domain-containing protein n=1 Tax=Dipodascopsis tothii TaxID=44089 RepID=UPI0034CE5A84